MIVHRVASLMRRHESIFTTFQLRKWSAPVCPGERPLGVDLGVASLAQGDLVIVTPNIRARPANCTDILRRILELRPVHT